MSSATPADLDEMVEMAERIARRREEAQAVLGLLGRSGARLVSLGRASVHGKALLPKSSNVVRLRPDATPPWRYQSAERERSEPKCTKTAPSRQSRKL